ncbi:MAG: class I SAM-dependent methyltransferase [Chlorobiaceae bacterium]|nr:class I SAM-dependent methyltransferase [Chlorobiaceae bacterium]
MAFGTDEAFTELDLGAGTGLLSMFIVHRFPRARFTLRDMSGDMLEKARKRFAGMQGRFSFEIGDYSRGLQGSFDLVVSALSIHHIEDPVKSGLFTSIFKVLSNGGLFINADQVKGETEAIEHIGRERLISGVVESGIAEDDFAAVKERMKADRMGTLEDQLVLLRSAGFGEVNCRSGNYSFAVFSGLKTSQSLSSVFPAS